MRVDRRHGARGRRFGTSCFGASCFGASCLGTSCFRTFAIGTFATGTLPSALLDGRRVGAGIAASAGCPNDETSGFARPAESWPGLMRCS